MVPLGETEDYLLRIDGSVDVADSAPGIADGRADALPNPFRAETSIRFLVPAAGDVVVDVFDVSGRRVRSLLEGHLDSGAHLVPWDGRDEHGHSVSPGVYFARVQSGARTESARLHVMR